MGVYYTQYVVPEPAALFYRPDAATLATLVEGLVALRWIDAAWRTVPIVGTEHRTKGARRSLAEDLGVLEALGNPVVLQSRSPASFGPEGSDGRALHDDRILVLNG